VTQLQEQDTAVRCVVLYAQTLSCQHACASGDHPLQAVLKRFACALLRLRN
jgi:hypothetical protein